MITIIRLTRIKCSIYNSTHTYISFFVSYRSQDMIGTKVRRWPSERYVGCTYSPLMTRMIHGPWHDLGCRELKVPVTEKSHGTSFKSILLVTILRMLQYTKILVNSVDPSTLGHKIRSLWTNFNISPNLRC